MGFRCGRRRPAPQVSIDCDGSVHWDGSALKYGRRDRQDRPCLFAFVACLLVSYAASWIEKIEDQSSAVLNHTKGPCVCRLAAFGVIAENALPGERTVPPSPHANLMQECVRRTNLFTNHHRAARGRPRAPTTAAPGTPRRERDAQPTYIRRSPPARTASQEHARDRRRAASAPTCRRVFEVQRQRHGPERHAAAAPATASSASLCAHQSGASRRFIAATIRLMHRSELQLRRAPERHRAPPHGLEGRMSADSRHVP